MADRTKISWTDHTFNPWIGCQKVSSGCDHCYAENLAKRFGHAEWGPEAIRQPTSTAYWEKPLTWQKNAERSGIPQLVFCASMADVFDNQVPEKLREMLWRLIYQTPNLIWQVLAKRPQNVARMLPPDWPEETGWPNIWMGVSAENQEEYDRRWPILATIPAAARFISYEPALGPLRLAHHEDQPDWLIWGGESGPGARPMEPKWARAVTAECLERGIPVFGKQWGNYKNNPLLVEERLTRLQAQTKDPAENGKGGALLDGKLWREFPGNKR